MEINFLFSLGIFAILLFIFFVFRILFKVQSKKAKGHDSKVGWTFFLKKQYAQYVINKHKRGQQNVLRDLKEYDDESLKISLNKNKYSHQLYGADHEGNSIFVKYTKTQLGKIQICLVLRTKNYGNYTLSDSSCMRTNANQNYFDGCGLKFECIQHFSKWRLTFSGMMRKENNESENQLTFVRFNFFWSAANVPIFWPFEWNTELMATAVADKKWRNLNLLNNLKDRGFSQFGACKGQARIYQNDYEAYKLRSLPKFETIELNFPGIRQRIWRSSDDEQPLQSGTLYGTMSDGTVIEVGAFNLKDTHAQFGNVRAPNGKILPISWTNFNLKSLEEIQQQITIYIAAEGHDFDVSAALRLKEKISPTNENSEENFIIPVEVNCNKIQGFGFLIFWKEDEEKFIEETTEDFEQCINHHGTQSKESKMVLSFLDNESQSTSVSGGKGSSLAILKTIQESKNLNFPKFDVPQGFIVSTSAYEEHLDNFPEILSAIYELESIAYEKTDGDITTASQNVQKAFLTSELSELLKEELSQRLNRIKDADDFSRFAVRSSGVTEDGEELSSAGQNETFLGLKSNQDIFEAIIKCWSSLYSFQSVLYRKRNIQPISTTMAVVIQKMVDAESAGVIFSRHFQNGDPRVIVITANYGLGESVVSAIVEPDTFLIKRQFKSDQVEILASIVGDKKIIVNMDDETCTKEVELDDQNRKKLCLSLEVVLELSKISIFLEKLSGSPRDIEFAVTKDKKIYLLQSRAITALNDFTDYEIIHEMDSAVMSNQEIFSKANVGEVFPGAVSALSLSIVRAALDNQTAERIFKSKEKLIFPKYFTISHQQVFLDVYKIFFQSLSKNVQVKDRAMYLSMFGSDVLVTFPEILSISHHRNKFNSENVFLVFLRAFSDCGWNINSYFKRGEELCKNMKITLSQETLSLCKSFQEILSLINAGIKIFEEINFVHLSTSNNSILYQMLTFIILLLRAEEMTPEHQRDIAMILSSIGNVVSASIPEMIREIAKSDIAHGKDKDFLEVKSENGANWLSNNCPEDFELFQKFIDCHGHRGIKEYELASKAWVDQPEKVIEMIQTNIRLGVDSASFKELAVDDILDNLKTPLSIFGRRLLRIIIPRYHKAVQLREESKSMLISCVNELRRGFTYLGRMMVNNGLLPSQELIFHLTYVEIQSLITFRNSQLISKAIRREKVLEKISGLKFEEIIFGDPKAIKEKYTDDVKGEIVAKGMPVCGGLVTARACVLANFSEIHKLQKGDILVTYSTDIGWSPYFPLLSGICTEIGGLISHCAVVTRECNIPCIVGAFRATEIIKHGEMITLNADEGFITKTSAANQNS